jgi:hypothetical protein
MEYSFIGELGILLRKESGLAEVARMNGDIEKYATHCFRQIEKVLSEFIYINPGHKVIGKYLLNGHDMILKPSIITSLNSSVSDLLGHTYNKQLNRFCLILKINSIKLNYGKCEMFENSKIQLTQKEENKIFKSILYFKTFGTNKELTENALKIDKEIRPSFWAFNHMYNLRNINSHLNSNGNTLIEPNYKDDTEMYRIQRFYIDPLEVLKQKNEPPGFYQRYVDMVLFLYSEFLKTAKL